LKQFETMWMAATGHFGFSIDPMLMSCYIEPILSCKPNFKRLQPYLQNADKIQNCFVFMLKPACENKHYFAIVAKLSRNCYLSSHNCDFNISQLRGNMSQKKEIFMSQHGDTCVAIAR
jgi:hypothetical protein